MCRWRAALSMQGAGWTGAPLTWESGSKQQSCAGHPADVPALHAPGSPAHCRALHSSLQASVVFESRCELLVDLMQVGCRSKRSAPVCGWCEPPTLRRPQANLYQDTILMAVVHSEHFNFHMSEA